MIINPKYKNVFFSPFLPGTLDPEIPDKEEETATNLKPKKKNLITVLKKLLKAFGGDDKSVKNNAVDIIDKIADNASGGGSGGGNVLTLYVTYDDSTSTWSKAYKDIAMKEMFSSNGEAVAALTAATVVKLCSVYDSDVSGVYIAIMIDTSFNPVACAFYDPTGDSISIVHVAINNDDGDK